MENPTQLEEAYQLANFEAELAFHLVLQLQETKEKLIAANSTPQTDSAPQQAA